MEQAPQNNSGTAKNNSRDGERSQPKLTFDYPNYEAWYADTEKYGAAEAKYWRRQNTIGGIGLIFGSFTFAAAVVAAVIAYKAYTASTNAVAEAKRQADEAKRQADAAETQIGVARETENRQLRPYLYISHSGLASYAPRKFGAEIQIYHTGQTPAYKVRMDATVMVAQYRLLDPNLGDITKMGGVDHFEYSALHGPEPARQAVSTTFEPQVIEMVMRTDPNHGLEHRFYLFGVVRYLDIFGKDEHAYRFCFVFHPDLDRNGSEIGCEKYNHPG